MKSFAIKENKSSKRYYGIRSVSIFFSVLLIVVFTVVSFFAKVNSWLQYKSKIDLFNQNLSDIVFYFWSLDSNISKMLLGIDTVVKSYLDGENILKTKDTEINNLFYYISENKSYLKNMGFKRYEYIIDLFNKFRTQKQEVKRLLGENEPQNYLVILQNTNEKRPNGGFFGSFAFMTVDKARITNLEIIDAYYPNYIAPKALVPMPKWANNIYPNDKKIGFVGSNRFGFTDIDGKNIKDLYELSFGTKYDKKILDTIIDKEKHEILLHKYIRGVIFVRLDLFTKYFPQLEHKSREWQFVNANIDIIRGEVKNDKKEKFIKEANLFFQDNWKKIFGAVINNLEEIIHQRGVNIYLSNTTPEIENILQENDLTTQYNTGNIYSWDINISSNKLDGFITKTIEIFDEYGNLVETTDTDILAVNTLDPGKYHVKVYYSFNRPLEYDKKIAEREKDYEITMTDREKSILGVIPSVFLSTDGVPRYRGTESVLYYPSTAEISNLYGAEKMKKISTPFAKVLKYNLYITHNNQTKILEFDMKI